jgi:hypothetical protein
LVLSDAAIAFFVLPPRLSLYVEKPIQAMVERSVDGKVELLYPRSGVTWRWRQATRSLAKAAGTAWALPTSYATSFYTTDANTTLARRGAATTEPGCDTTWEPKAKVRRLVTEVVSWPV